MTKVALRWITGALCSVSIAVTPASAGFIFAVNPNFASEMVTGSEPGLGLPIPGATGEEQRSALIWNLRSGLNVAALQCQGYRVLDTTDNYNNFLSTHSAELNTAYKTLEKYFTRTGGPKAGMKAFDDYNTKTYNGFSTLYAQPGFCETASSIGREILFAPRGGGVLATAQRRMREFRNSLIPAGDRLWATRMVQVDVPYIAPLPADCYDKVGALTKKCLKEG